MPVAIVPSASSQSAAVVLHQKHFRPDEPAADRPLMLITYHVSPRLAENLIANRIPFLDTAGNVYLDEPEATVMITGREKPTLRWTDTASRSTTPKGLRVSFALATQPGLVEQPYRTIAEQSGVALNTVNLAVDDLIARRLVVKKNGRRMIAHQRHFIKDWVDHYATGLRTKLGARRYASGVGIDWWQGAPLADFKARLGGECAAEVLTHANKPVLVTVYAHGGATSPLMKAARLRPDPHGEVEILESFWPERAEQRWNVAPGVVHPVLAFADLITSGDSRNAAVAQTLYERFLDH
ncbi:type IV toxin-antitoxin system AbiEi family antitoxin [Paraburkholderia kirstenboschensis]|uniref:type IV toxin-antitoxin system AbiEi family antitoxin n=1 Tax=Paraburkholderia kirstenboschensis TaxID=1245436 RepID=UPI002E2D7D59|nr:type IV toxin-antitoxin system AbiEi family antitoxin [Paraburkholderia kirstenboschensis]